MLKPVLYIMMNLIDLPFVYMWEKLKGDYTVQGLFLQARF